MIIKGFHLTENDTTPLGVGAASLDELTSQLSDGFYTTFSTLASGTRVLGLSAHLDRLYLPAKGLPVRPSISVQALRQRIAMLVQNNLPHESRVRLILTKDSGDVYLGLQAFNPLPEAVYRDGVHVVTSSVARQDPRIKGTDFIARSAEERKLVRGDIFEVLLTHNGRILEGMTSNFYAVSRAVLITAQKGILLGVTRRVVLRLARGAGMSIEYRAPHMDEKFDETFLTSSSRGVVPIVSMNGVPVGQGRVGAWTKTLSLAYQAYVEERSEKI